MAVCKMTAIAILKNIKFNSSGTKQSTKMLIMSNSTIFYVQIQ